jgi:hypothetical protein
MSQLTPFFFIMKRKSFQERLISKQSLNSRIKTSGASECRFAAWRRLQQLNGVLRANGAVARRSRLLF